MAFLLLLQHLNHLSPVEVFSNIASTHDNFITLYYHTHFTERER